MKNVSGHLHVQVHDSILAISNNIQLSKNLQNYMTHIYILDGSKLSQTHQLGSPINYMVGSNSIKHFIIWDWAIHQSINLNQVIRPMNYLLGHLIYPIK